MTNIIVKHKQKLRIAVILAAIIGISMCAIALFLTIWWRISFLASLEPASKIMLILAGIAVIPAGFYYLMRQRNKFQVFCDIYADPITPKHSSKVMVYSLIKYLSFIFILTMATNGILIAPMLFVWTIVLIHFPAYFKLWKYHGYSVPLLLGLSGVVASVSALLSPFFRTNIWAVVEAFLRFSNI